MGESADKRPATTDDKSEDPTIKVVNEVPTIPGQVAQQGHEAGANAARLEARRRVEYRELKYSSGPLPPAEELLAYEQVFPGCAQRIVEMAEAQSRHRQQIEATVVGTHSTTEIWGQRFGFFLAAVALVGGMYLLATDHSLSGFAVLGSDLVTLVGLFVYGKREQGKELRAKATPIEQAGRTDRGGPPAKSKKRKR